MFMLGIVDKGVTYTGWVRAFSETGFGTPASGSSLAERTYCYARKTEEKECFDGCGTLVNRGTVWRIDRLESSEARTRLCASALRKERSRLKDPMARQGLPGG